MKIRQIDVRCVRVNQRGDWLFVLVRTDDGLVGIGEASHGGATVQRDRLVAYLVREQIAPLLLGHDPRRVRALIASLAPLASGQAGWTAISGVEQALWDLCGQAVGLPVHQLLGGPVRDQVRVYANINRATADRSPEGFAASARQAAAEGFQAIKCAPFDGVNSVDCRDAAGRQRVVAGLERVAAVREALGHTVDLYVDCHGRLDEATAVWVGQELAALGVRWFEEPVPAADTGALARLRDRLPLEIIGGEHLSGLAAVLPYLHQRLYSTIMPDVKHCGGIGALLAIGEAAHAAGVACAPHNPSGPVALAASLQAAAVMPAFRVLEYAWGEVPWRSRLTAPAEEITGGAIAVPVRPGIGVALDEAELAEHAAPL